jgi:hypothetical protein
MTSVAGKSNAVDGATLPHALWNGKLCRYGTPPTLSPQLSAFIQTPIGKQGGQRADCQNETAGKQRVLCNLKRDRRFELALFRTRRKSFGAPLVFVDDSLQTRGSTVPDAPRNGEIAIGHDWMTP